MAWGWTPGVGSLGKQRGKVGGQIEGRERRGVMPLEQERRGDGKARGMSMVGRVGSWAPFPSPSVPWGPFLSRVPTWLGWPSG